MASSGGGLVHGLGSWWRGILLGVLLAGTAVLWAVVDDHGLGIGFLFLLPAVLAAYWWGARGGLVAGLGAGALFAISSTIAGDESVVAGSLVRGGIYAGVGYLVGALLDQRVELRGLLAAQRHELAELRAIQEVLVPAELPVRPGVDLAACYVPAQEGVAGDFFMVAEGPAGSTVLVVGDVVGKGVEAARRASFVRAALATFAGFTDDPVRLLHMANYSLIEKAGTSETFVTAVCATFHPGDNRLVYATAGHIPPMLLDSGVSLDLHPGIPLGIEVDLGGGASEVSLDDGRGVLLYTDGLSEARPPRRGVGSMLGAGGIADLVTEQRGAAPQAVVEELRRKAVDLAGASLPDDLCVVALRAVTPPR